MDCQQTQHSTEIEQFEESENAIFKNNLSSSDDDDYDEDDMCDYFDEPESFDTEHITVHTLLYKDIENMLLLHGKHSVCVRVFEAIDEVDVDLNIPLPVLDVDTSEAWGVYRSEPLTVRINFSLSMYTEYSGLPNIEVFQSSKKARFGICSQVQKVIETFIGEQWTQLANYTIADVDEQSETNLLESRTAKSPSVEEFKQMLTLEYSTSITPSATWPYMSTNFPVEEEQTILKSLSLEGKNPKEIPNFKKGFLVQLFHYICHRIPTLSAYCVLCDEPHVLQSDMLKPSVCSRELCVFASQTCWVKTSATNDIDTSLEVADLLINLTAAACRSYRKGVFDPYPTVVDPSDSNSLLFDPKQKNCDKVKEVIDLIPPITDITNVSKWLRETLDAISPVIYPLIQWIITSNRSHIVNLPPERQLVFMCTPHQFLFLSNPPAKEAIFRAAKEKYGSTFAFHGSGMENWHSIIRHGLLNATGTQLEVHGAMYGEGIYLSPEFSIAILYSNKGKKRQGTQRKNKTRCASGNSNFLHNTNIAGIAICEVITTQDLKKENSIWVCSDERYVCTRFLFVYENGKEKYLNVDTQREDIIDMIKAACCGKR